MHMHLPGCSVGSLTFLHLLWHAAASVTAWSGVFALVAFLLTARAVSMFRPGPTAGSKETTPLRRRVAALRVRHAY